jgi:hypothetical protein
MLKTPVTPVTDWLEISQKTDFVHYLRVKGFRMSPLPALHDEPFGR